MKLFAVTLPVKLATLPVKLLVTFTKLAVTLLPKLELPVAVMALVTVRLPLPSKLAAKVGVILPTDVV